MHSKYLKDCKCRLMAALVVEMEMESRVNLRSNHQVFVQAPLVLHSYCAVEDISSVKCKESEE